MKTAPPKVNNKHKVRRKMYVRVYDLVVYDRTGRILMPVEILGLGLPPSQTFYGQYQDAIDWVREKLGDSRREIPWVGIATKRRFDIIRVEDFIQGGEGYFTFITVPIFQHYFPGLIIERADYAYLEVAIRRWLNDLIVQRDPDTPHLKAFQANPVLNGLLQNMYGGSIAEEAGV